MIRLGKHVSHLAPQTVASNGTNGFLVVDTRPTTGERYEGLTFHTVIGPGASTAAPITLAMTESVDTNATSYTAIAAFTGGTAVNTTSGFVLPTSVVTAVTGPGYSCVFNVNLRTGARKRYLKVSAVPGTTASICIVAHASQPNQSIAPNTTGSGGDTFIVG